MTFLNPFMLFGLAAASVPLLIHLLSLRKLRTVEFSTLRFLKELQKSSIRRVKIRQWLLLALRTLMIIAIVLAFARPALHGSLAGLIGSHAATAMVLLIDDSPSTAARNDRGEIFPQIRDAALTIGSLAGDNDNLFVVRLSDIGRQDRFPAVRTSDDLRRGLASMEPTPVRVSFRDALAKAAQILATTSAANRELYFLTDGQANQFAEGEPSADSVAGLNGVHVFVVQPGPAQGVNGAVSSVDLVTRVLTKSRPAEIQALVRDLGPVGPLSTVASVYLSGTRMAQQTIDLRAGESTLMHARFLPRRTGTLAGYVQIEDDALEIDNRRYFSMTVPEHVSVFLCGDAPADLQYLRLGLTLGGDSTLAGLFAVQTGNDQDLARLNFDDFDVVCLSNVPRFSLSTAEALARFVRAGGGLMLFPGPGTDISSYDETLFGRLGIPPALPPLPAGSPGASGFTIRHVDLSHPLFEGMFEDTFGERRKTVETPSVSEYVRLTAGASGHAIMTLSTQSPFLAEYQCGSGRVLAFAVDAAGTWSTLPTAALFAPLLYRSVLYLANAAATYPSVTVGNPIEIHLRLRNSGTQSAFAFFSPSGQAEKVVPEFSPVSGAATFRSKPTLETGIYRFMQVPSTTVSNGQPSGEPLAAVAVNPDTAESDLRQADQQTVERFCARFGVPAQDVRMLPAAESPATVIEQSRFGVELWRFFVGAAFLLGIIELAVGNALRRAGKPETDPEH